MTVQYSTALRNARLDAIETKVNQYTSSPLLRIYTGSAPANCAAAATGTLLIEIALPTDWMAAATGGTKSKQGTWSGTGIAGGNAGWFGIFVAELPDPFRAIQGTVGTASADLIVESVTVANGQAFSVSGFTITDGMA